MQSQQLLFQRLQTNLLLQFKLSQNLLLLQHHPGQEKFRSTDIVQFKGGIQSWQSVFRRFCTEKGLLTILAHPASARTKKFAVDF